jgi:hypothetical protein
MDRKAAGINGIMEALRKRQDTIWIYPGAARTRNTPANSAAEWKRSGLIKFAN